MATGAKINIKNIDYFKFKKIVIDGNRDDYGGCSREVKSLCDCVQTLSFRDDEFDDVSDRARFDEVISLYRYYYTCRTVLSEVIPVWYILQVLVTISHLIRGRGIAGKL